MAVKHTEQCKEYNRIYEAEVAAYKALWPNHCTHCGGWGGSGYSYDPSPAGVSLGSGTMYDWDPCPHCLDKLKCPRCGTQLTDSDGSNNHDIGKCPACGWDEAGDFSGLPLPPDCLCWELNDEE